MQISGQTLEKFQERTVCLFSLYIIQRIIKYISLLSSQDALSIEKIFRRHVPKG